ncbi:uncharacterized protein isoform X2 [Castor canadensis]|uniref:Uncharacterized protein isoform X2 n=1 Tax=Castor canadensis TaxID=51338 RepID=A0AC58L0X4_CASCN
MLIPEGSCPTPGRKSTVYFVFSSLLMVNRSLEHLAQIIALFTEALGFPSALSVNLGRWSTGLLCAKEKAVTWSSGMPRGSVEGHGCPSLFLHLGQFLFFSFLVLGTEPRALPMHRTTEQRRHSSTTPFLFCTFGSCPANPVWLVHCCHVPW